MSTTDPKKIIDDRLVSMTSKDGIRYLLREVEATHTKTLDLKRLITAVKKEREVVMYELKKYEHVFRNYHQLQTRFVQLINKNEELSHHKLFLFTAIKRLQKQIDVDRGIPPPPPPPPELTDNKPIPQCLLKPELCPIPAPEAPTTRMLSEVEYLPDLPVMNRFTRYAAQQQSPVKRPFNKSSPDKRFNKHQTASPFKPIRFVYNTTITDPNSKFTIQSDNNNIAKTLPDLPSNIGPLFPIGATNGSNGLTTSVSQESKPVSEKVSNHESDGKCIKKRLSHWDVKDEIKSGHKVVDKSDNKISKQIDCKLSDENMKKSSKIKSQNNESNDRKYSEKSVKVCDNSHIKRLRKSYNESVEDKQLLDTFTDKKYSESQYKDYKREKSTKSISSERSSKDRCDKWSEVAPQRSGRSSREVTEDKVVDTSDRQKCGKRRDKKKKRTDKSERREDRKDRKHRHSKHESPNETITTVPKNNPNTHIISKTDDKMTVNEYQLTDCKKQINSLVKMKNILSKIESFGDSNVHTSDANKVDIKHQTIEIPLNPKCQNQTPIETSVALTLTTNTLIKTESKAEITTQLDTNNNTKPINTNEQKILPKKHTKLMFKLKRNNINKSIDNKSSNSVEENKQKLFEVQRNLRQTLLQKLSDRKALNNN